MRGRGEDEDEEEEEEEVDEDEEEDEEEDDPALGGPWRRREDCREDAVGLARAASASSRRAWASASAPRGGDRFFAFRAAAGEGEGVTSRARVESM